MPVAISMTGIVIMRNVNIISELKYAERLQFSHYSGIGDNSYRLFKVVEVTILKPSGGNDRRAA
jgi:hypothetical protein